jgi:EpsI family protein
VSLATRRFLGICFLITAVMLLYWPTVAAYSVAWTDFDNRGSTHGYLIALMCVALLYLRRAELRGPEAERQPFIVYIALALLSLAWLLAYRASIQTAHEVLLPIILWIAIYAVFGLRTARVCLFPVGFLYFALPFWGVINDPLQALTIVATHIILQLFGLPVVFYGNLVHIPEGTFAIEGGCSGLHFLVVGLAIAAYYGALHRDNARNRVLLLALAAVLALFTNWVRVSVVITAGHLTDMQSYLVRVSHYGFGWAVFAVAMAVFFLVASRIPVDSGSATPAPPADRLSPPWRPAALGLVLAVAALVLGPAIAWSAVRGDARAVMPPRLPETVRGWSGPLPTLHEWRPVFIGADSEWIAAYRRASAVVEWYTADYAFQRQGRKLSGYDNSPMGQQFVLVDRGPVASDIHRFMGLTLQDKAGAQSRVWYVYEVAGREMTSPLRAELWYGVTSLLTPVDSRILAFRAQCNPDCAAAQVQLGAFVDGICDDASRFGECRSDR